MSNGSAGGYCGLICVAAMILMVLGSCSNACSGGSHSSSSRSSSHSSPSYSSGKPSSSYTDSKGGTAYSYSDGSTEYTDGYGHVVRDSNGDGKNDYYSSDGGNSWSRM